MAKRRLRDIVVLLPGITGSVLQKDGKDLWAISGSAAWRALTTLGGALQRLELADDDPDVDDLGDGIRATRLMPDAHLVPGLVKIDGYAATARLITDHFQVERGSLGSDQPANFYEFPYDWRRDNRVAARHLQALIDRQLPRWRERSGARDAKVILIAHSMGGLIARHYLEVLGGWKECRLLITFGTPYRGSLNALDFLANGYKKLFVDLTDVMRTFTSVYQLLPIYKTVRAAQGCQRVAEMDGIPGVKRARAEAALAFHRCIENAVIEHRKDAAYLERGYKLVPVVGTRQPTSQSAELSKSTLTVLRSLPDGVDELLGEGDGTVPRLSATPIELSDAYQDTFVAERHGSLQNNRFVLDDLLGRLQQSQVTGLSSVRGAALSDTAERRAAISLDLDDVYIRPEPVVLRAQLVNVAPDDGRVDARIEPVDGAGQPAIRRSFHRSSDSWTLELDDLAPGLYRVEVSASLRAGDAPSPVHDLIEVAG